MIDNCLLERQGGDGRVGRGRGKNGGSEREEGWCLKQRDRGERWVTEGKGGQKKRAGLEGGV